MQTVCKNSVKACGICTDQHGQDLGSKHNSCTSRTQGGLWSFRQADPAYIARRTALERQDYPCTYLAHHELESALVISAVAVAAAVAVVVVVMMIIVMMIIVVDIIIITIVVVVVVIIVSMVIVWEGCRPVPQGWPRVAPTAPLPLH